MKKTTIIFTNAIEAVVGLTLRALLPVMNGEIKIMDCEKTTFCSGEARAMRNFVYNTMPNLLDWRVIGVFCGRYASGIYYTGIHIDK